MSNRLTREQAAIIGAFTGISCGPFQDIHGLAEKTLGKPIWTHEFAYDQIWVELKEKIKPQFIEICAVEEEK